MRLGLTHGILDPWVGGQHPLDRLRIHEPAAAPEDAVDAASEVQPPGGVATE